MRQIIISLLIGLVPGILLGLFIGWEIIPVEFVNQPLESLAPEYQDSYTVAIASGYMENGDLPGAVERLSLLGNQDIPTYVREITERYIENSHAIEDIQYLVALSEALGQLTNIMEPYRQLGNNP